MKSTKATQANCSDPHFFSKLVELGLIFSQDLAHNSFATRLENIFVIGQGKKANVTLPRGGGIRLTPLQELAHKNLQQK